MAELSLRQAGEAIEAMLSTCVWNGDPIGFIRLWLQPSHTIESHMGLFGPAANPNRAGFIIKPLKIDPKWPVVERRTQRRKNHLWLIEGYWDVEEEEDVRLDWYDQLDYILDVINSPDFNQLDLGVGGAGIEMLPWDCTPYPKRLAVSDSWMLRADWRSTLDNAATINVNPNP